MSQSQNHIIVAAQNAPVGISTAPANSLLTTALPSHQYLPLGMQLQFFEEIVGGHFIAGGRFLLSGQPGSGKSRLATQLCLDLARQGIPTLAILTEETPAQMKRRVQQMTGDWQGHEIQLALSNMLVDQSVFDVTTLPEFLVRHVLSTAGAYHNVKFIVLDSIQGQGLASSSTKSYAKVLDFARTCTENGITTLLLCHQTKRGDIAGPKSLEHGVDASLCLRRAMRYSVLTVRKNRYGPAPLPPRPLRFDAATIRLEPVPQWNPTPAMARTYAGTATGLLELQASVSIPVDGIHGKTTAPGLPKKEIEQLVNCISHIKDLDFADLDYAIHCRLPGNGQYNPIFGLPLCMAMIGSYLQLSVPEQNLYLGEIDLYRNVRAAPSAVIQGLTSDLNSGNIATPIALFLHPDSAANFTPSASLRVVPCKTLEEAVFLTWPELR